MRNSRTNQILIQTDHTLRRIDPLVDFDIVHYLELPLITTRLCLNMDEWTSDSTLIIARFQECVKLSNQGGGNINVYIAMDRVKSFFQPEWVLHEFKNLNMVNIIIPAEASFCLMHPEIIRWELNRDDFETMNQEGLLESTKN